MESSASSKAIEFYRLIQCKLQEHLHICWDSELLLSPKDVAIHGERHLRTPKLCESITEYELTLCPILLNPRVRKVTWVWFYVDPGNDGMSVWHDIGDCKRVSKANLRKTRVKTFDNVLATDCQRVSFHGHQFSPGLKLPSSWKVP